MRENQHKNPKLPTTQKNPNQPPKKPNHIACLVQLQLQNKCTNKKLSLTLKIFYSPNPEPSFLSKILFSCLVASGFGFICCIIDDLFARHLPNLQTSRFLPKTKRNLKCFPPLLNDTETFRKSFHITWGTAENPTPTQLAFFQLLVNSKTKHSPHFFNPCFSSQALWGCTLNPDYMPVAVSIS